MKIKIHKFKVQYKTIDDKKMSLHIKGAFARAREDFFRKFFKKIY